MKKRVWTAMPVFIVLAILMLIMACISFKFSKFIFFIELLVACICIVVVLLLSFRFKKYIQDVVSSAHIAVTDVNDRYIDQIKTPAAVVGENYEIVVFNTTFRKTFFRDDNPINQNISFLVSKNNIELALTSTKVEVLINNLWYSIYSRKVASGILITFIDITKYKEVEQSYLDTKKSVAIAVFDNLEDFDDDYEGESAQVSIMVEGKILAWANENNALYRKTYDNKYLIIFDDRCLLNQINKKFSILDEVRTIVYNDRSATVSIGIGRGFDTLLDSHKGAKKALDMALGRGGDQVAIFDDGDYEFFGGVSKGVEKTNNVKIRVIADNIAREVESVSRVLVMGHSYSDLDCIGSSAGVRAIIKNKFKKPCYVVCDTATSLAKDMIEYLKEKDKTMFISPDRALDYAYEDTLLFVVDTHSPDFVESKSLLDLCGKIIVIDHHRKMVNHIDNTVVNYHVPNASSTSELVAEFCKYMGESCITKYEAEALFSGIMLDTKNFLLKTTSTTFEVAAFLRKKGADTIEVRDMFANSLDSYKDKSELVANAERVNNCAITVDRNNIKDARIICAQAADDLLTIKGIYASFVIFKLPGGEVNISARSYGKINVQIIMEKLGGGGHQTMAAAQMKKVSLDEARERLIKVINDTEANKV